MKKIIFIALTVLILCAAFFAIPKVYAYTFGSGGSTISVSGPSTFGEGEAGTSAAISRIFNIVITISEVIFVILFLIGGVLYLTALGNDDQVSRAKKLMVEAVIGIVIVFAAFAIGTWVINRLKGQESGTLIPTTSGGGSGGSTTLPSPKPTTQVSPPPASPPTSPIPSPK